MACGYTRLWFGRVQARTLSVQLVHGRLARARDALVRAHHAAFNAPLVVDAGLRHITNCMVVQLGLAKIKSSAPTTQALR